MGTPLGNVAGIRLRVETSGRVKDLKGYVKSYTLPDHWTAAAQKFISRLACADVAGDIEETHRAVRESFGFKRREIEASTDVDGTGMLQTPQFCYCIRVELDRTDPANVVWHREVTGFHEIDELRSAPFQRVFGKIFDTLVLEFNQAIDVPALIDHLEDRALPGIRLSYPSTASSCEITLTGLPGSIQVHPDRLEVHGRGSAASTSLLDQFFDFIRGYPGHGPHPALQ